MNALGREEGHISKQSSSYRQGLVLGLTMAEVMILLIFCLLIALAAFLKTEHSKRVETEEQLRREREAAVANRDFADSIKKNPGLAELLTSRSATSDQGKLDEFWRELVEGNSIVRAAKQTGLTSADVRSRIADIKMIKERRLDLNKIARNALITESVDKAIAPPGSATPGQVTRIIERGLVEQTPPASSGHKWPPIITLNDAKGRFFKSGSAEVDPEFKQQLLEATAPHIGELIKQYDVDVIEVVGHTDEQPIGNRPSNLDRDLVSVLSNTSNIATISPADNAGLGLARAVSVVGILRQSGNLASYKILPLSGGQLINTNETLALGENPGDIRERRRIEIRLRKATPHVTEQSPQQETIVQRPNESVGSIPMPQSRPAPRPPTYLFPPR